MKKAIELFESRTGIKVISARDFSKTNVLPYIQFTISASYDELFNKFYVEKDETLGDLKIGLGVREVLKMVDGKLVSDSNKCKVLVYTQDLGL